MLSRNISKFAFDQIINFILTNFIFDIRQKYQIVSDPSIIGALASLLVVSVPAYEAVNGFDPGRSI